MTEPFRCFSALAAGKRTGCNAKYYICILLLYTCNDFFRLLFALSEGGPWGFAFHPYFSNFFLGAIGTASNMDIEGGRGPARFSKEGIREFSFFPADVRIFFLGGVAQILLHYFSVGMLPLFEPKMNLLF